MESDQPNHARKIVRKAKKSEAVKNTSDPKVKAKKWNKEEETTIADYIRDHFAYFKSSNRMDFLRRMRTDLKINEDVPQLKNKVAGMEKKYKEIKDKCGKTGEGLTEETIEWVSWAGYVKNLCHYYFILDEVMKARTNVEPPFEFSSGNVSSADLPPMELENEPDGDHFVLDMGNDDVNDSAEGHDQEKEMPTRSASPEIPNTFITKKQKTASNSVGDALKLQATITGEHYKRLDEQRSMKLDHNSQKLKLEERKLDIAEKRQDRELDLRELEIKQKHELEQLRFAREKEKESSEIEKLKLQIRLAELTK